MFWPFSIIRQLKTENSTLKTENSYLESELSKQETLLNDFSTKKSLGRIVEVPRKIGDTLYVIMKRDAYPAYDKELIGMRRSDTTPENNIKIISITIVGYVIQPSGTYITFREQYDEDKTYHININSPNLFMSLDAALGEMYGNSDKKNYMHDPFVVLKREDVLILADNSQKSYAGIKYPMNNINL